MSDLEQQGTGTSEVSESTEAPAEAQSTESTDLSTEQVSGEVAAAPSEPAYSPNYKFKVKDKELEFDDFVRGAISNKEHEAKLRDLYERAHGLEEVKQSRASFEQKWKEADSKYSQVAEGLERLGTLVKNNRLHEFFDALSIPKDKIVQYAIQELQYQELSPEQRAVIDEQRRIMQENEQVTRQYQSLQSQVQQMVQAQARNELVSEMSRPEVTQAASAFDARMGRPGAFESEVIRRGQYYEQVHRVSPPASQLVQEVLGFVGMPQATQPTTTQQQSEVVQKQGEKPVIPTFSSGSQKSPTQKVPTSIAELKQLRQQRAET